MMQDKDKLVNLQSLKVVYDTIQQEQERLNTALTTLGNAKQDKLTAGENISIVNNVISATGGSTEREWVLKGVSTDESDLYVDLSGCTEFYIETYSEGATVVTNTVFYVGSSAYMICYGSSHASQNRYCVARYRDGLYGIECISKYQGQSKNNTSNSTGTWYNFTNYVKTSDITRFRFMPRGTTTELKIYAR